MPPHYWGAGLCAAGWGEWTPSEAGPAELAAAQPPGLPPAVCPLPISPPSFHRLASHTQETRSGDLVCVRPSAWGAERIEADEQGAWGAGALHCERGGTPVGAPSSEPRCSTWDQLSCRRSHGDPTLRRPHPACLTLNLSHGAPVGARRGSGRPS